MMPQWEFLDFVARRGAPLSRLQLCGWNAEATDLLAEDGQGRRRPAQGRARSIARRAGHRRRRPQLAPARRSRAARYATSARRWTSSGSACPRSERRATRPPASSIRGRIIVLIDRGDYWQCAYVFPKGAAERVRARGIDAFRADVARVAPDARATIVDALADWDDVKLLTVALDRLDAGIGPGLLAIGDAAHAMSPIGGVGINVAIQDAVAAANILAGPMAAGRDVDSAAAQGRRNAGCCRCGSIQAGAEGGPATAIIEPLARPNAAAQATPPFAAAPARPLPAASADSGRV